MLTVKRLLYSLLIMAGLPIMAADSTISALPHRTSPFSINDVMVWEITGVSDYNMQWTDLTNLLGSYFDPTGAAYRSTNGFPWGVLYDPAGAGTTAAHDATNTWPWMTLVPTTNGYVRSADVGAQVGSSNYQTIALAATTNGYLLSDIYADGRASHVIHRQRNLELHRICLSVVVCGFRH